MSLRHPLDPAAHDCQPIRQIKPDFGRIDLNYSLDTSGRWQSGSLLGVWSPHCGLLLVDSLLATFRCLHRVKAFLRDKKSFCPIKQNELVFICI